MAPQRPEPRLADWQWQVLAKLSLLPTALSPAVLNTPNGDVGFDSKVYLRPLPQQAAPSDATSETSSTGRQATVQPVDPRLLAALRVMTLRSQGEGSDQECAFVQSLSIGQLGDWMRPLSRQHELEVLAVLVRLCTALYQGLGSTLQQDRALQQQLEQALAAVPALPAQPASPSQGEVGAGGSLAQLDLHLSDPTRVARDTQLAIQYRISIKSCLEGALQAIVARRKGVSCKNCLSAAPPLSRHVDYCLVACCCTLLRVVWLKKPASDPPEGGRRSQCCYYSN